MKNKTYEYSSTQVEPNEEISNIFLDRGVDLIAKKHLSGDGFEDNPHITVLYGIHDLYPSARIIDIIETYPKFTITMGNISLFKEEDYDVVKVDINCSDLHSLRGAFMNNCYFTSEHPTYIPHITVAYVKPNSCDFLVNNPAFRGISFVAETIIYSCKDGTKRTMTLGLR